MSLSLGNGARITEHAKLDARNTFGVRATAELLVEVTDTAALPELFSYAMLRDPNLLMLGGGSNLLFAGDPPGAVLALATHGIGLLEDDGSRAIVRADAGVVWHDVVMWTLGHGLSGLENLALIPGTVGAAPIQNIGAYGVEVRECIHVVEAFDRQHNAWVRLAAADCAFAYRDSLFKQQPDRYLVTAVEFMLPRNFIAEAVMRIRRRKLPDPALLGNAGSFFKNPIIAAAQAEHLLAEHPGTPCFRGNSEHTRKLSAAWLIDQCGFKGYRDGDAGVSSEHALVLVNHGHATGLQLLALARRIAAAVHARFGVMIEPEPRIIGAVW